MSEGGLQQEEVGDPMCVCDHRRSLHVEMEGAFPGVFGCTVQDCACGPGCIHEGFVDKRGPQ